METLPVAILNICNGQGVWSRRGLHEALIRTYGHSIREQLRTELVKDFGHKLVVPIPVDQLVIANINARIGARSVQGVNHLHYQRFSNALRVIEAQYAEVHVYMSEFVDMGADLSFVSSVLDACNCRIVRHENVTDANVPPPTESCGK